MTASMNMMTSSMSVRECKYFATNPDYEAAAVCVSDNAASDGKCNPNRPTTKIRGSGMSDARKKRETIPLPPGAPQGEAGWKPRDWLATRSIPLK